MIRFALRLILMLGIVFSAASTLVADPAEGKGVKVRCLEDYGNGRDNIEVDWGGEQRRLKIDFNETRFFTAKGVEIRDARQQNLVIRFNKMIYVKYNANGKLTSIRLAE